MRHNLSSKGWMYQLQRQQHVIHMPHPFHWIHEHPAVQALMITGLIILLMICLGSLIGTGIYRSELNGFSTPSYPFGPAY